MINRTADVGFTKPASHITSTEKVILATWLAGPEMIVFLSVASIDREFKDVNDESITFCVHRCVLALHPLQTMAHFQDDRHSPKKVKHQNTERCTGWLGFSTIPPYIYTQLKYGNGMKPSVLCKHIAANDRAAVHNR